MTATIRHACGSASRELHLGRLDPVVALAQMPRTALGFRQLADAGIETGLRDRRSFAVEQGEIRLVFTSSAVQQRPARGSPLRRRGRPRRQRPSTSS